jgi:hypothetical protein
MRKAEREVCRHQCFEFLHGWNIREACVELRKNEKDLTEPEWKGIFDRTYKAFDGLLRNLGLRADERWTEAQAKALIARPDQSLVENEADSSEVA